MPTCRICQHTFKSLKFQSEHINICTRCVNTLNESPEPARSAEARFAEKLARGMQRNAERDLTSDEEWKRRKAQHTLDNLDAAVAAKLHDWITKLLATPGNSTHDYKIMRAYRRRLLRMEGFSDYRDRNWKEVARRIRRRDGFKCRVCDATDTTLDVHHIIYLSHHGTNQQSNLITLCRVCHEAEHDRIFDWPESQDPESAFPIQPLHDGQTLPSEPTQAERTSEPSPAPVLVSVDQPNSGIDHKLMMDGTTIAGAYIESGVRNFLQYATAMIEDLGDGIKPYLLSFWEGCRHYPGLDTQGMTDPTESACQYRALITLDEATDIGKESDAKTSIRAGIGINADAYRAIVALYAARLGSQATSNVIRQLERMETSLSGDSGLKNAWEEVCAQVQGEESIDWPAYVNIINELLYSVVEVLDMDAQLTLWAITEEGWDYIYDHHVDRDAAGYPLNTDDIVTHLKGTVLSAAANYESPSLYRYIWGEDNPEDDWAEKYDEDED